MQGAFCLGHTVLEQTISERLLAKTRTRGHLEVGTYKD
jgi:hypothetical protein